MKMAGDIFNDSRRGNIKSKPTFYRHFQAQESSPDGTLESPFKRRRRRKAPKVLKLSGKNTEGYNGVLLFMLLYPFLIWVKYYRCVSCNS